MPSFPSPSSLSGPKWDAGWVGCSWDGAHRGELWRLSPHAIR